jgi:YegS/Rv2252/BmrU family lipid kinase
MNRGVVHQKGRILVIVNPSSGRRKAACAERLLRELGGEPWRVEVIETRAAGDATRVSAAAPPDTSLFIAVGGDGTINEVIAGRQNAEIPIAVVPTGVANVLAREFRIPRDIGAACRLARRGMWRAVDLGRTDRGCFLAIAGAGFDAAVTRCFAERRRGNARFSSYVGPAMEMLRRYAFPRFSVELDGRTAADDATSIVVSNTRNYGALFLMTPNAKPDDGLFDVCIFRARSSVGQTVCAAAAVAGCHGLLPGVTMHRARRVRCISTKRVPVQLDGDPRGFLPITFEIEPAAVRLVSP